MKKNDIFFEAMKTRDPRFDGKFFIGVKTTGIYCRPICPAKPKRENVEFFKSALEAEKAGYRPCLRCRPESAPSSPAWIGKSAIVQRALRTIHSQQTAHFNEDDFANKFGVTARHLRRLFIDEIGKTPKQIVLENRLNLARKLISETSLKLSDVAFASGFQSIRRFNDAFKDRFKRTPSEIRRKKVSSAEGIVVSLPYRPPFDFEGLRLSYQSHRIGDLEWFEDQQMFRVVSIDQSLGYIRISNNEVESSLQLEIIFADLKAIQNIILKVRAMFDLDSDPLLIANAIESHPHGKKLLRRYSGIRLPSGWDSFEIAVSTILGQLVSIEQGRKLVHSLIQNLGRLSKPLPNGKQVHLFPLAADIAKSDLQFLKTTQKRKETLKAFCHALRDGKVSLDPNQDVEEFIKNILSIKGIGPWTAHYMALKVLRDTNAFPSTDLVLARASHRFTKEEIALMQPWRGYLAALLWREYSEEKSKTSERSNK